MYSAQANRAEIPQKPESIGERRQCLRHRVSTPAYVGVNGSPTAIALDLSEILDISEEGICIQAASPLQVDRSVNLRLDLSETAPRMNISGVVAWSEASGRTGIRLLDVPEASRRSLEEWLVVNALAASSASSLAQSESQFRHEIPELQDVLLVQSQRNVMPEVATMPGDSLYGSATAGRDVKATGSDLNLRLQRIAERALTLTRASGAAIALIRNGRMICAARAGADAPSLGAQIEVGSGLSGECVRTREILCCDDSETDPRVDREICRALGIRSILAVPVCSGETITGLLEVFSPRAQAFTLMDPAPLERLGRDILLAIDWSAGIASPRSSQSGTPVRTWQPVSKPVAPAQAQSAERAVRPRQSNSRSHKFVLAAAIVVLVLTGGWLISPWARTWIVSRGVFAKTRPVAKAVAQKLVTPVVPPANDFENLRWLANQGDPTAQYALGRHYAQGEDVQQDDAEAVRWFSKAAEQGHIVAQATLGAWYWAGRGVPKDLSKAYFWLILARAGGYERSNDLIGPITAEMTHNEVLAAQQEANDWLTHHQVTSKTQAQNR